jgi:hypothetical protein
METTCEPFTTHPYLTFHFHEFEVTVFLILEKIVSKIQEK